MRELPWSSIFIVAASLVALYTLDRVLARVEQSEVLREANLEHSTGLALLKEGRTEAALPHLSRASVLDRNNRDSRLDLAEALHLSGHQEQAGAEVRDVLNSDSNDGRANLLMARLMDGEGRSSDADAYYHRAIYGAWYHDPAARRLQTRIELADYLARQNRQQELLSELLVLQDAGHSDLTLARRVAGLFLKAGSTARAVQAYRDIIRASPDDAEAFRALGEAELRAGDFRAAETAFLAVVRNRPNDAEVADRLRFASTLERMDPTSRRLPSAEKYRRSAALLAAVRGSVTANCPAAMNNSDAKPLLDEAEKVLKTPPRGPITNEGCEAIIALAEQLWNSAIVVCGTKQRPDDPVPLLMDKLKAP
jgi:tetratricopeptide (TPR) repeat protein